MGEAELVRALRPWERQLRSEGLRRWLLRGAVAGLILASAVLLIGWLTPLAMDTLRPWAVQAAIPPLIVTAIVALWPSRRIRAAAQIDRRLNLGDRLATAWTYRAASQPIAALQRSDAIARLERRSPHSDLQWRPARFELGLLGVAALVAAILLITPSPQQPVLDRQAAEALAVQQANDRLEALRTDAAASQNLTPDQARQLDELLKQAQSELSRVRTQQGASSIVARAESALNSQLADPNADLRDETLAAMSETLAAEPQTRQLADALQHEDAQAASDALKALAAQSDQLGDVERQALSRALQRAANVSRSDPRAASALRDAASAIGQGNSSDAALSATDAALRDSIQAAMAQSSLRSTAQRLRQLQAQLASGGPLPQDNATNPSDASGAADASALSSMAAVSGTPVALDSSGGASALVRDPGAADAGTGAGVGAGAQTGPLNGVDPGDGAENVFVPGRSGNGPADQDLTDQPFTLRGSPRPYRDVLSQYAQSGRDYVDRPDVSPAVRDLVKQYFQQLEEGAGQ